MICGRDAKKQLVVESESLQQCDGACDRVDGKTTFGANERIMKTAIVHIDIRIERVHTSNNYRHINERRNRKLIKIAGKGWSIVVD